MSVVKEGWTYKELGSICNILNGYAFKGNTYVANGIRVIRISNVQKGIVEDKDPKFFPLSSKKEIENYLLNEGDLLISLTGNVGRVGLLCRELLPAALNQRVACLRLKDIYIDKRYLYHFLNSDYFENICIKNSKGVAQLNMSTVWLSNFAIPVPPLPTQQSIVSELDKINELIALKKSQLKDLDTLAQSIFYEMFGDPVTNEKGWKDCYLYDMGELSRGVSKHRPRNAPELLGGSMPLIQTGDVANADMYIKKYSSTYSNLGVSQSKVWKAGTLCVTIAATIGKCAILGFDACFPDSVVGFTVNNEKCNNEYVYFIFKRLQSILEENAPAVAQKNINLKVLNDLLIPLPPLSLQHQFAERVEAIERMKQQVQTAIKDLETLLASRMQYWFD